MKRLLPILLPMFLVHAGPAGAAHGGPDRATRTSNVISFSDVTQAAGIDVTAPGPMGDFGSGAAFTDFDGDGDLDLYVVMPDGVANRLYRNDGAVFTEVAATAGVADANWGRGIKCADYDNDGDVDFFLGNHTGPNRLFRNNGDGTFTDVTAAAGLTFSGPTYGAAWGDYDNDGNLDLYVVNYYQGNLLYHNGGNGQFVEVAAGMGIDDPTRPGFDCAWFDYDNDNDVDLYVINDLKTGNKLYQNDGNGQFTDVSAVSGAGVAIAAMGIALADYDQDGYMDLYISNTSEGNVLLHNNGDGTFTDLARDMQVLSGRVGWGTAFLDCDNDGDDDLYVVNFAPTGGTVASENILFRNDGSVFANVTATAGVGDRGQGFGLALGDYNGDGFVDMFVHNRNFPSVLYRSGTNGNNWFKVRTEGQTSNRDGIGARVHVVTGVRRQMKDVLGGSSYLSHHSLELVFGLGAATNVDSLIVRWPSGIVDIWTDLAPNQSFLATEGGSPVPVLITAFDARVVEAAIELSWSIASDESFRGFRIYRSVESGAEAVLTGNLLAPGTAGYTDASARPGVTYGYVLSAVLSDGSEMRSPRVNASLAFPPVVLSQNAPNPFNPSTTIRFSLPEARRVALDVFDARGRHVRRLVEGLQAAGPHTVVWDGRNSAARPVATGVYFYRLRAGNRTLTRRMILVK